MGSDPKTEAGWPEETRREYNTAIANGFVVTARQIARRGNVEARARLISPDDCEGQVAGIAAVLEGTDVATHYNGDEWEESTRLHAARSLYDAGLRLGQREDAPLDAARLERAIGTLAPGRCCWDPAEDAAALAAAYEVQAPRPSEGELAMTAEMSATDRERDQRRMTVARATFDAGLAEAARRLADAGMHPTLCPAPDKPCDCGIDAVIWGAGAIDGRAEPESPAPRTHGRHCPCSACARQDWASPDITPICGMHGPDCPPVYAPARLGQREGAPLDAAGLDVERLQRALRGVIGYPPDDGGWSKHTARQIADAYLADPERTR